MPSQTAQEHREEAEKLPPAGVAVVTISDTRTAETDKSGRIMTELLEAAGHRVVEYMILKDDPELIREWVVAFSERDDIDAVLTNGGTGISPRDGTYEAISMILTRELPGFGELFRMLSWDEVGAAAMLSRAIAGLRNRTLIFSTPGSTNAVRTAMERLIIPELAHLVYEVNKT